MLAFISAKLCIMYLKCFLLIFRNLSLLSGTNKTKIEKHILKNIKKD